ncbi:MAG: M23 family metallopeptidase [Actinomycetaceae bacterium]|nr:M23 family metallopeptidase [Actinomycetaceae bacterium]
MGKHALPAGMTPPPVPPMYLSSDGTRISPRRMAKMRAQENLPTLPVISRSRSSVSSSSSDFLSASHAKPQRRRMDAYEYRRITSSLEWARENVKKEEVDSVPVQEKTELTEVSMLPSSRPVIPSQSFTPRQMTSAIASICLASGVGIYGFEMSKSYVSSDSSQSVASLSDGMGEVQNSAMQLMQSDSGQEEDLAYADRKLTPSVTCSPRTGLVTYGQSTSTLVWPLGESTYRLTSSYGGRTDPVYKTYRMHEGQDFAGSLGTPVYSVADGVVEKTGGVNNALYIKHERNGEVFYSVYVHMYARDVVVKEGQKIKAGQRIGAIGSYGKSTGPHLHFEIRDAAMNALNPMTWMKNHGAEFLPSSCS